MTTTTPRLHGLDALRAAALGLGIVLHSMLPFSTGGFWLILDSRPTPGVDVPLATIHLFRMVLFMLLAGYFGRMVLQRRGPVGYLRDRGLRILLPLLALAPPLVVSLGLLALANAAWRGLPPVTTPPPPPGVSSLQLLLNPGHLWFLAVLLQCVVLTVAVRAVLVAVLGPERAASLAGRVGGVLAHPAGILLAAVPYLLSLLIQGDVAGGILQPLSVLPELPSLTGYLGAFLVGWFLHARPDSLQGPARIWPVLLVAAVLLTAATLWSAPAEAPLLVTAALTALAGWAWTYGLVGLCTRHLTRDRPVLRYLADASYWAYLVHLPVLIAIQIPMAELAWPVPVKLVLAWALTAVVLLLSYDLLVRSTWVGRWLNGHRRPRALGRAALPGRQPARP